MRTFLFTWNPSKWKWHDLAEAVFKVTNGEEYNRYWSCGNRKDIRDGDRFLLTRLGVAPKGIIGCGSITSDSYPLIHWDESKASQGIEALRNDLLFSALSDIPLIDLAILEEKFPGQRWTPQSSGTQVDEGIANTIFKQLEEQTGSTLDWTVSPNNKVFSEGQSKKLTIKTYDRSNAARQACLEEYGYNCAVCEFNFGKSFGSRGEGYIEVHHLNPIATIGTEYESDQRPPTSMRKLPQNAAPETPCHFN